jgi:hypothetical protein
LRSSIDQGEAMWTFYGLADIGALTGNIVGRWQTCVTGEDRGDDTADASRLRGRMSTLGVDADTFARVEPALFGNLQTLCGECERRDRCRNDLRRDPSGVGWEDYCPNAVVLNAIAELRWFRVANKGGVRR